MNLEGLGRDVWVGQLAPLLDARDVCALAQSCRALRDVAALLWPVLLWRDYGLREGGCERYRELCETGVWRNPAWTPRPFPTDEGLTHAAIVGTTGCGKTFLMSAMGDMVSRSHGIVTFALTMGAQTVRCIDVGGSERLAPLRRLYYANMHVAVVCFDVGHRCRGGEERAFPDIDDLYGDDLLVKAWVRDVRQHAPDARIIIVGTKSDLRLGRCAPPGALDALRDVDSGALRPFAWGVQMAREVNAYAYMETSALTAHNTQELLPMVVEARYSQPVPASEEQTKKCALM